MVCASVQEDNPLALAIQCNTIHYNNLLIAPAYSCTLYIARYWILNIEIPLNSAIRILKAFAKKYTPNPMLAGQEILV